MTAAHVTFYEFNIELNRWSRKDVEGSLFVVKRNTQPRFQFIVMNRRNTENLVEDLLGDFEYEVQVPYLLYRNAAQEVNGIWFYNSHDCEAIANLFSRILNAFSKANPKSKVPANKSEFEELEATPSLSVIEGPLEPQTSSSAAIPDVPDESFVNFFSTGMSIGNASNTTITGPPHQSSTPTPLSSYTPSVPLPPLSTIQTAPSLPSSSSPLMSVIDSLESNCGNNLVTSLVKPSLFATSPSSSTLLMPPISSSVPAAPPLHPPVTMQRPYGTPLLQPFPPPNPPPSLTPTQNYGPAITRDKVRDALLRLVQNNQFIDLVYRELLHSHYP